MSEDFGFDAALKELDKSETHLVVRVEFRRWGKPVTVVQGLPKTGRSLDQVAHVLKGRLATGGTAKEGVIMLQGDHRARIKDELVKLGFQPDHIEIY
ncbi:MAG TPA: stress response translation initiation inhibitor YciH [Candidatus Dormibacteraeota bacterium]|jgi:translation initiation factor 1|nr:stress response translation initiation inhibitor YciH [Candidatus Dormibacteraeota bacterium]